MNTDNIKKGALGLRIGLNDEDKVHFQLVEFEAGSWYTCHADLATCKPSRYFDTMTGSIHMWAGEAGKINSSLYDLNYDLRMLSGRMSPERCTAMAKTLKWLDDQMTKETDRTGLSMYTADNYLPALAKIIGIDFLVVSEHGGWRTEPIAALLGEFCQMRDVVARRRIPAVQAA